MPTGVLSDAADQQAFPSSDVCFLGCPSWGRLAFAASLDAPGVPCAGRRQGATSLLLRAAASAVQWGKMGFECQVMLTLLSTGDWAFRRFGLLRTAYRFEWMRGQRNLTSCFVLFCFVLFCFVLFVRVVIPAFSCDLSFQAQTRKFVVALKIRLSWIPFPTSFFSLVMGLSCTTVPLTLSLE